MRLIDADLLEPDADYDDGDYWAVSIAQIQNAPTIEPERKKGEWREHIFDGIMGGRPRALMCSYCNTISLYAHNYCPNCGSYNGGEQDETGRR